MGNAFSTQDQVHRSASPDIELNKQRNSTAMSQLRQSSENCVGDTVADNENESGEEYYETSDRNEMSPFKQNNEKTDLTEFKKELAAKREARRKIIAEYALEMQNLRKQLEIERKERKLASAENSVLRDLLVDHNIDIPDSDGSKSEPSGSDLSDLQTTMSGMLSSLEGLKDQNKQLRLELTETYLSLQSANSEIVNLNKLSMDTSRQINALKEVVAVSKKMLKIREGQHNELKQKLLEIEKTMEDRESQMLSTDLRKEYERQLQNIRSLRVLYEERARLAELTRLTLLKELEEQKSANAAEADKRKELTERVDEFEAKINELTDTLAARDDQLSGSQAETKDLKAEMNTINKLCSQMLLGYNSNQDLDKMASRLEQHRALLTDMVVREDGSDTSSALPRLLLDLLTQLDESEPKDETESEEQKSSGELGDPLASSAQEIVGNLPKVWRVLMELLRHQRASTPPPPSTPTSIYNTLDTSAGPKLVPSVSKTYIRLKDLIVEKMSLVKEMNKMKQLNSHLDNRLQDQERRLGLVTSELSKTWHVVGRLRRHHQQLHTHEKILRYELQQKRKMLNDLKDELEYCREKWDKAKEKNTESEKQWKKLRIEFSNRKKASACNSINVSAESGYSDERPSDDNSDTNDESDLTEDNNCKKVLSKGIENLPDSSTDHNLIAEREDPISDMLDVADLPLDGQDADDHLNFESIDSLENQGSNLSLSIPESTNVINNTGSEPNCSAENNSSKDCTNVSDENKSARETNSDVRETPPSGDIAIDNLKESDDSGTTNAHNSVESLQEGKNKLDVLTDRDTHADTSEAENAAFESFDVYEHLGDTQSGQLNGEVNYNQNNDCENTSQKDENSELQSSVTNAVETTVPTGDDVKPETESSTSAISLSHEARFAARDERLRRLEEQARSLVDKVNGTASKSVKLSYKLDELHNIYGNEGNSSRSESSPVTDRNESKNDEDNVEDVDRGETED